MVTAEEKKKEGRVTESTKRYNSETSPNKDNTPYEPVQKKGKIGNKHNNPVNPNNQDTKDFEREKDMMNAGNQTETGEKTKNGGTGTENILEKRENHETVTTPMGTGNKPDNPHVTDGVNQIDTGDKN